MANKMMKIIPAEKDLFEQFWQAYPKKKSKKDALKAWFSFDPDLDEPYVPRPIPLGEMLNAIKWQMKSRQWQDNDGQYIPYPASWIRGAKWEDVTDEQARASARKQKCYHTNAVHRDYPGGRVFLVCDCGWSRQDFDEENRRAFAHKEGEVK